MTSFTTKLQSWSGRAPLLLLGLLIVSAAAAQLLWISQDETRLPVGEGYVYLSTLLEFMDRVGPFESADSWSSLERLSKGGRPPLYQLLTAPFIALFGRSEDAALGVNVLFLALLAISTYGMGRMVGGSGAGLLAALLVVTYPPIVQLTRVYLPHSVLPACVALSCWLLLLLLERRSIGVAWLFGASLALGLLIHPRFAYAAALPATLGFLYVAFTQPADESATGGLFVSLWRRLRDRLVVFGLLPATAIALGLALPWYVTHGLPLLGAQEALRGEQSTGEWHAIGFANVEPTFWWYLRTTPGALSNVLALCALGGVLYAIARRRTPGVLLSLTLVGGYIVLSREPIIRAWWNFALVLPLAAALTALWTVNIRRAWIRRSVTAGCVFVGVLNFVLVSWGAGAWSRPVARALSSPIADETTCESRRSMALCPASPRVEHWRVSEIQRQILADPSCQGGSPCRVQVIAYEQGGALLSQVLFNYYLARDRLQDTIVGGLGSPAALFLAPYDLEGLLESDYLIVPEIVLEQPVDSYYGATLRFLNDPPAAFADAHRTVATFAPTSGPQVRLLRRVEPLTLAEAETSIAALEVADEYLSRRAHVLEPLLTREGRHDRVVRLFRDTLREWPMDVSARVGLANAYARLGDRQQAIAELETALSHQSDNLQALRSLGNQHLAEGSFAEAATTFRRVLELNPADTVASIRLARALEGSGRIDAAIRELESAAVRAPQYVRLLHALASTYLVGGRESRAISVYRTILELDPADAKARNALSRLEGSTQRPAEGATTRSDGGSPDRLNN